MDELTPLTDTISDLQYTSDGGSYAKVVFRHRYYAPDVAAANGGESSVHFAFSVHQSHLFTKNDDGTANFAFTPGWFDDLSVENMQVRWHNYDGFVADNTGVDGDYLTWDFGAMGHGQQAMVHVTVPVTNAAAFDPGAAMTTDDYDSGEDLDEIVGMLVTLVVVLLAIAIIIIAIASQSPEWGGGFGSGIDPDDWFWYTNGVHTIRCARSAPPPSGYHRTDPPPEFRAGGGKTRGGGVSRHHSNHSGCASSCACACASSCACACACAGGGRAGCSVKDFYTVKLPKKSVGADACIGPETEDKR